MFRRKHSTFFAFLIVNTVVTISLPLCPFARFTVEPTGISPSERFRIAVATFSGSSVAWIIVEILAEKAIADESISGPLVEFAFALKYHNMLVCTGHVGEFSFQTGARC